MRWESTAELRFAVPPETTTKAPKLQQKWVRRIDAQETVSEWRDVPTIVVPQLFIQGAISDAYATGWRPEGFGGK